MIIAGMNVGRMLVAKLQEYKSEKMSLFDEDDSHVVICFFFTVVRTGVGSCF
jgi:hypothetical protein